MSNATPPYADQLRCMADPEIRPLDRVTALNNIVADMIPRILSEDEINTITAEIAKLASGLSPLSQSPRASLASSASGPSRAARLVDLEAVPSACRACASALHPHRVSTIVGADACRLCAIAACEPAEFAEPFCKFLAENPTVFHAVDTFGRKLEADGYVRLSARDSWVGRLEPGGKYYVTRNGSSLIAFAVGQSYKPGAGVAMVAGHVDAVTARLRPVSKKPAREGYVQLGVAPYAGGLNPTWWDRDLAIGGRVVVREGDKQKTRTRLVRLDWPIARVPSLAIHFGLPIMGTNDAETQAVPIIGLDSPADAEPLAPAGCFVNSQPARLVRLIASQLGVEDLSTIVGWDLELYDSQPAQRGGLDREFIFAGRIDDKLCSWAALLALLAADHRPSDTNIKLAAFFDDEEIGSLLRQGARGNFLPVTVERAVEALCAHHNQKSSVAPPPPPPSLSSASSSSSSSALASFSASFSAFTPSSSSAPSLSSSPRSPCSPSSDQVAFGPGVLGQTYARSFLISADVSHAVNPNFTSAYSADYMPRLNVGITLACDANGHFTTDAASAAVIYRVGELGGGDVQLFQIRNGTRSGGTVGPMLSSAMGVRAADAGMAQLSMHSIRATCGSLDPGLAVRFFKTFYNKWEQIDREGEP